MKKLRLSSRIPPSKETLGDLFPGGSYTVKTTSRSTRYEGEGVSLVHSDKFVGFGLMKLIVNLRNEVRKNLAEEKISTVVVSPQFSQLGNLDKKTRAAEVDISSAYLTAAQKIGAISEATYQRLTRCAKSTRLMVIGSLATKRVVSQYKDGKKVSETVEQDQDLAQVWRWIMCEVDKTMREVAQQLGKGFMFYWFDAAFVKVSQVDQAKKAMADRGYGSKSTMVTIRKEGRKVYLLDGRKFPLKPKLSATDPDVIAVTAARVAT